MVLSPRSVCSPDGSPKVYSILLVHKPRGRDAWQLPQGGVEAGETLEEAALRELEEEAGLSMSSITFTSTENYTYDFPPEFVRRNNPVNSGQHIAFVVIESESIPPVQVDNHEIDAYVWVLPEDLPKYIDRKVYLDAVTRVLREYRNFVQSR